MKSVIELDTPNAQTIAAIKEVQDMKAHPENYTTYNFFDEILAELDSELDAE